MLRSRSTEETAHHLVLVAGFCPGLHRQTACMPPSASIHSGLDIDLLSFSIGPHHVSLGVGLSSCPLAGQIHFGPQGHTTVLRLPGHIEAETRCGQHNWHACGVTTVSLEILGCVFGNLTIRNMELT